MDVYSQILMCFLIFQCITLISGDGCKFGPHGRCLYPCPPETHTYVSPCGTAEAMTQRTCRSPEPRSMGMLCDLSRCDCYEPKVWDEAAAKCVLVEDCSDQSSVSAP